MKNIDGYLGKALEEHRLDDLIESLARNASWDDVMLAMSNIAVARANGQKRDGKEYKLWMKRAYAFHDSIIDSKTASVQKRKLKKIEKADDVDNPTEV